MTVSLVDGGRERCMHRTTPAKGCLCPCARASPPASQQAVLSGVDPVRSGATYFLVTSKRTRVSSRTGSAALRSFIGSRPWCVSGLLFGGANLQDFWSKGKHVHHCHQERQEYGTPTLNSTLP
mmetsp:Transcript_23827/g.26744  ORF Transcript_23827/g.26744 Transcript_23827/m.26744 type:complete len:123 (+) Transcript_23827:114-482(+)